MRRLLPLVVCCLAWMTPVVQAAPAWWSTYQVTNGTAQDYAAANQGQVKNLATKARNYFEAKLPGGAGTAINTLVNGWQTPGSSTQDYAAVNQAQVKTVAKLFYDRLIALGITSTYPWTTSTGDDQSYALVNQGQVKNLFAFDLASTDVNVVGHGYNTDSDHLPDAWELSHFGGLAQGDAGDFDGDGVSNLQEYANGTAPEDYFNGEVPVLEIISGNNQEIAAGAITPQPFVVKVKHLNGTAWPGAAVTFRESTNASQLVTAAVLGSARTATVTITADGNGLASNATGNAYYSAEGNIAGRRFIEAKAAGSSSALPALFTVTVKGLIDHWELDEFNGESPYETPDLGSGNNPGTLSLTPWDYPGPGVHGTELAFDGTTQYIDMGSPSNGSLDFGTSSFSISAWFKTSSGGQSRMVSKGHWGWNGGYFLGVSFSAPGSVAFGIGSSANGMNNCSLFSTTTVFNDNQWHQAVAVFDRAALKARIYVDGVAQPLGKWTGTIGTTAGTEITFASNNTLNATGPDWHFLLGSGASGERFQGSLDDVRLYLGALDDAAITGLQDSDNDGLPDSLEMRLMGNLDSHGTLTDVDGDGVPDAWELSHFGNLHGAGLDDSDGDGVSDHDEFIAATNPDDYFNGQTPVVEIISGNNQVAAPGTFALSSLVVLIHHGDTAKTPYPNAPVTYTVTGGSLALADSPDPNALHYGSVERRTGMFGKTYDTYAQAPATASTSRSITATAGTGAPVTFTVASNNPNVAPAAPTNVELFRLDNGDLIMSWQDNADNEDGYIIERSDDGGLTWVQVATAPANSICIQIASGSAGSTTSVFRSTPQNATGSSSSSPASHPGTTPPDPNRDTDHDGVNDREDMYPTDHRRWQDVPPLGLAWIDMSASDATTNVTHVALDDDNHAAYMFGSPPASEGQGSQITTKTWANGTATLAQTVTLDTLDNFHPTFTREESTDGLFLTPEGNVYANLIEAFTDIQPIEIAGEIGATEFWSAGTRNDLGLPSPFETRWEDIFWFQSDPWNGNFDGAPERGIDLQGWSEGGYFGHVTSAVFNAPSGARDERGYVSYLVTTGGGASKTTLFGWGASQFVASPNVALVNSDFSPVRMNDNGWAIGYYSVAGPGNVWRVRSRLWKEQSLSPLGSVGPTDSNYARDINNQGQVVGVIWGDATAVTGWIWKGTTRTPLQELLPEEWREQIRNIDPFEISNPAPGDAHQVVHILFRAESLEGPGTDHWVRRIFRLDLPGSAPGTAGRPEPRLTQLNSPVDTIEVYPYIADFYYQKIAANGSMVGLLKKTRNAQGDPIPSEDQYTRGALFIPAELAVDANRDGVIRFGGNYNDQTVIDKPVDKTSQDKPFRFWVNDDRDGEGDGEEKQTGAVDSSDTTIKGKRDLEDFTRLWIYIGGLQQAVHDGNIKVGLKWKNVTGSPTIKVYEAVEGDGGTRYVKDDDGAGAQLNGDFKTAKATVTGTASTITNSTILPVELFEFLSVDDPNVYLLFEGSGVGKGQLVFTFHNSEGTEIGEGPGVWIDLKNVKEMYTRAITTPHSLPEPWDSGEGPYNADQASWVLYSLSYAFTPAWDEEKKVFVYVNGSNESEATSTGNAETMFKRLWHQGYKGRFSHFRWDTQVGPGDGTLPAQYNLNEWIAWTYGESLKKYMASFPQDFTRNVCAHSLGNVVVGAALERGMGISNYLLMQAALPAGCYDTGNAINGYQLFADAETNTPTPEWDGDLGYRGFLNEVAGNLINFYNPDDYALATGPFGAWEGNQEDYKPDNPALLVEYIFYPFDHANQARAGKSYLDNTSSIFERQVTDIYEGMSFVSRSRSKAAGAISTGGPIIENVPLNSTTYSFGDTRPDHSAEFTRRIQQLQPFYQKVYDTVR